MTMLKRANWLSSSSTDLFSKECRNLKAVFLKLKYSERLIDLTISRFNHALSRSRSNSDSEYRDKGQSNSHHFAFQRSNLGWHIVRRDLHDLSAKINKNLQPIFTSRKLIQDLRVTENKPSLVNQTCVVYEFKRNLVIQVMSDTRSDTYFNVLMNIGTQLLGNISKKVTTSTDQMCTNNLTFWKNAEASWNVWFMKCYWSRKGDQLYTRKQTPSVQNCLKYQPPFGTVCAWIALFFVVFMKNLINYTFFWQFSDSRKWLHIQKRGRSLTCSENGKVFFTHTCLHRLGSTLSRNKENKTINTAYSSWHLWLKNCVSDFWQVRLFFF